MKNNKNLVFDHSKFQKLFRNGLDADSGFGVCLDAISQTYGWHRNELHGRIDCADAIIRWYNVIIISAISFDFGCDDNDLLTQLMAACHSFWQRMHGNHPLQTCIDTTHAFRWWCMHNHDCVLATHMHMPLYTLYICTRTSMLVDNTASATAWNTIWWTKSVFMILFDRRTYADH